MDVQDQEVHEGLVALNDLVRCALAAKFHPHPHDHYLHAAEDVQRPENCPVDVGSAEASPGMEWRTPGAQIKLVVYLATHGPQTMSEVAEGLDVTTPAVTGLVDKLEKRGMVERLRDSQDRRVVRVRLAPHAQRMAEAHMAERRNQMRSVLATLKPEEQQTFIKTLRLLAQTFYSGQEAEAASK
ncbi:MAG TPA: MarR family transcriptional regulator [Ktedonobacterales bacterium]|nr:MarR family transcriptional regulator [Ktedonobacterales bacterium]